jgi:DNA-binding NtrC family response regulator
MFSPIIGVSQHIENIRELIDQAANSEESVLVCGETGVGKDLIVQHLYHRSKRFGKPFVKISCLNLTKNLLESTMFNYELGTYSDDQLEKQPILERVRGGVLFLDEIGEMPLTLQSKLLQIIQSDDYSLSLNSVKPSKADVWVITATSRNLEEAAIKEKFRQDLYCRLSNTKIVIEPLRRRPEDIPLLIRHYVKQYKKELAGGKIKGPRKSSIRRMIKYQWPGNVRELQNIVKRILIFGDNEKAFKYTIAPFDDEPIPFSNNMDRFDKYPMNRLLYT